MPRDGDVDYGKYSDQELLEALQGINAKLAPENYRSLTEEMHRRGVSATPVSARRKGPALLALAVALVMIAVFQYGVLRFPDAPIRPCGDESFCGKQGQPHTAVDYRAFVLWERSLLFIWPSGMLAVVLLIRKRTPKS